MASEETEDRTMMLTLLIGGGFLAFCVLGIAVGGGLRGDGLARLWICVCFQEKQRVPGRQKRGYCPEFRGLQWYQRLSGYQNPRYPHSEAFPPDSLCVQRDPAISY